MRRTSLILAVTVAAVTAVLLPAVARSVPQPPHRFYGAVTVGGSPAPDGLIVTAVIAGATFPYMPTDSSLSGRYGETGALFKVPADDVDTSIKEGGVNNDTVSFYIEGVLAGTGTFTVGGSTELDLSISALPTLSAPANVLRTTSDADAAATFTWDAVNDSKSYEVRLDGGAFVDVGAVTTHTSAALTDGGHTFEVRAIDKTDMPGSSSQVLSFTIDTTAPTVSIVTLAPDPGTDATPTFTGTATDATTTIASVEYRVDSGAWAAATASDGAFDSAGEAYAFTTATLVDGAHTVEVRATDAAGNVTSLAGYAGDTFTVDTLAPAVSVAAVSPDPTTDATPTLTGTATDATTAIASVTYQVDGGGWTAAAASDGAFDSASEAYALTSQALADGSHILEIRATDAAGNMTTSINYATDIFTVDTLAPAVTVTPLSPDPSSDSMPTLTGTAADVTTAIASVEYRVDGGGWTTATAADSAFDEVSEGYSALSVLSEGTHIVEVRATDAAGNVTASGDYASDSFTIDTVPPVVAITALSPDPSTDSTPALSGTATDATTTIVSVEYRVDGGSWTSATASDGAFDGASEDYSLVTAQLADGAHTVEVRATDDAGNVTGVVNYATDTFTVSTIPPVLPAPTNVQWTTPIADSTPAFAWDAVAQAASYEVRIDSGSWVDVGGVTTYVFDAAISDDSHSFQVRGVNALDAPGLSGSVVFLIDTASPAVTVVPLSPDPSSDGTPTFMGMATDVTTTIGTVEYRVDGGAWTAATASDGAFDSAGEAYTFTTATLADGAHAVELRATDAAGNVTAQAGYASESFTVDTVAPAVAITAISPDPSTDSTPTFTGTATDATTTIGMVEYRVDGGAWTAATASDGAFDSAGEAYAFTTATLADGAHTVDVRATDAAGNVTASGDYASDSFTVDESPPVLGGGWIPPSGGAAAPSPEEVEGMTSEEAANVLASMDADAAAAILEEVSPDTAAAILETLEPEQAANVVEQVSSGKAVEMLQQTSPDAAAEIISRISLDLAVDILGGVDSDIAAAIVEEMTSDRASAILEEVADSTAAAIIDGCDAPTAADVLQGISVRKSVAMVEEISVEKAVGIIGQVSLALAADIMEAVTVERAIAIIDGSETRGAAGIVEAVSLGRAVAVAEGIGAAKAARILEQVGAGRSVDIIGQAAADRAIAIMEEVAIDRAALILENVSPEKAAIVMEGLSTPKLAATIPGMSQSSLMERLPGLTAQKLYSVEPEILFGALPDAPTEQLVGEEPPVAPEGAVAPVVVFETPGGARYLTLQSWAGEWVVVMGTPPPAGRLMVKPLRAVEGFETVLDILAELPQGVSPELAQGEVVRAYMNVGFEGLASEDIDIGHMGLRIEKEWLEENGIHRWSVGLKRWDQGGRAWIGLPTKRVGGDAEYVYYTAVVTEFGLFAVTGKPEAGRDRFEVLGIDGVPERVTAGEMVDIVVRVRELAGEGGVFVLALWRDGTVLTAREIRLGATEEARVEFRIEAGEEGEHELLAGRAYARYEVVPGALREREAPDMRASELVVVPEKVELGGDVAISVEVRNAGQAAGVHQLILRIDGEDLEGAEVALGAGQSHRVTFVIHGLGIGRHVVEVDGLMGSYVVFAAVARAPGVTNWWLIGSAAAGASLLAGLATYLVWRKRGEGQT